jgi:hypothetical protein
MAPSTWSPSAEDRQLESTRDGQIEIAVPIHIGRGQIAWAQAGWKHRLNRQISLALIDEKNEPRGNRGQDDRVASKVIWLVLPLKPFPWTKR